MQHAFKAVDTDNDGLVDASEFIRAVRKLNPAVTEDAAALTFGAYDTDGSGQLDIEGDPSSAAAYIN